MGAIVAPVVIIPGAEAVKELEITAEVATVLVSTTTTTAAALVVVGLLLLLLGSVVVLKGVTVGK